MYLSQRLLSSQFKQSKNRLSVVISGLELSTIIGFYSHNLQPSVKKFTDLFGHFFVVGDVIFLDYFAC